MMESPQPQLSDPPDMDKITLRFHGNDLKASDAFFQNTVGVQNGVTQNSKVGKNASSKLPDEFQKGVSRDVKVPGGMKEALLEDQNKNRLKSTTTMDAASLGNSNRIESSFTVSENTNKYSVSPPNAVSNNEISCGKSKSEGDAKTSSDNVKGDHVKIDVDMRTTKSIKTNMTAPSTDSVNDKVEGVSEGSKNNEIIQKTKNKEGDCVITMDNSKNLPSSSSNTTSQNHHPQSQHEEGMNNHNQPVSPSHFPPSCEKDLEILKNVRKVYVQLTDDNTPCYKISDESGEGLFETVLGDTNGSIWSRYFKQQQKVILVHDRNQRSVIKLEFGRSRTISCCQTLRFAAMTASFKLKPEEPLCIIFKDKECCVSCCCCPEATYETVPQLDSILPFSVFTKGRWKNRAELMVKHNDGSILGFIDKEQNSYSLTMGENLKPAMKACLIGFLIAMDVMDRQDSAGKFSCYLRPTTILLIILLLMLCITIGGYLLHFSSMFRYVKEDSLLCGTFDEEGSRRTATVPHFNNDRVTLESSSGETPPHLTSDIVDFSSPLSKTSESEPAFMWDRGNGENNDSSTVKSK